MSINGGLNLAESIYMYYYNYFPWRTNKRKMEAFCPKFYFTSKMTQTRDCILSNRITPHLYTFIQYDRSKQKRGEQHVFCKPTLRYIVFVVVTFTST